MRAARFVAFATGPPACTPFGTTAPSATDRPTQSTLGDGGAGDATSSTPSGGTDAGPDAHFCATHAGLFCADFEGPSPQGGWTTLAADMGPKATLTVDTTKDSGRAAVFDVAMGAPAGAHYELRRVGLPIAKHLRYSFALKLTADDAVVDPALAHIAFADTCAFAFQRRGRLR